MYPSNIQIITMIKPLFLQLLSSLECYECNYSTVNFTKKKKTLKFKRTEVRN